MSELKPRITENGIDYILVGDYYIPDLKLPKEHRPIGKYGRMHREYLREVHPVRLNTLTLSLIHIFLVKVINLAALGKPFPMLVHCPHSQQDMGVGIVSRRVGVMDCKISNHAFGNKLLLTKLPYKDSVLVRRYLSGRCV